MNPASGRHPKVSIGLPVYNGERYLPAAIESLLSQTFRDFELIICDNASTDGTEQICRSFSSRDPRVHYYRNDRNIGAPANFNRSFRLASGKYFKWAAHDDLCAPDFLLRCVEILEEDTSVVLCQSEVEFIDENGESLRSYDSKLNNINSPEAHLRFADLIRTDHWCFDIFGLIRTKALKKTPLIASYWGSDRNTLATLSLLGRFFRIPECLFFSRDHSERSIRTLAKLANRTEWLDPGKRGRIEFPHWRILLEYIKSLRSADLAVKERAACFFHVMRWMRSNINRLKMDLLIAAKHGVKFVAGDLLKHKTDGKRREMRVGKDLSKNS